jgi:GntR family transcriptional repressor for pyruvate dehydrogenase complex
MSKPNGFNSESQLTMQVVNHINSLIKNGSLRGGDKIPPEREFAKELGISRASLRMGIGYLASMGVLKVKHGVGAFVSAGPPKLLKFSLPSLSALHGLKTWHMFEARFVLEQHLAELAANRGLDEHFGALAEELAEMYATIEDPSEYLIHDIRFHQVIAEAAGNPILTALMETITAALYEQRLDSVEASIDLKESAEQHREIYKAIRSKNGVSARQSMERHLKLAEAAQRLEESTSSLHKGGPNGTSDSAGRANVQLGRAGN